MPEGIKGFQKGHHFYKGGEKGWFKKGYQPSKESRQKIKDALTGKKRPLFSDEWKRHISKSHIGKCCREKHWNWRGGSSFEPYTTDWNNTLKRAIRERDHYSCQNCGKLQSDRAFDVHHKDGNKKNCNPDNLITLCHSCHSKVQYEKIN